MVEELKIENLSLDSLKYLKFERVGAGNDVALITLNRPQALNALCRELMVELSDLVLKIDSDSSFKVIVLTGSEKAFAAGADIKQMSELEFTDLLTGSYFQSWDTISKIRKPIIAAVNGFALGGGTELALMCDIVYAGEKAIFGQPEVTIGTIPGLGGTQRWPRFANKSVAMEVCLTGDKFNAVEAKTIGLVSKIFPVAELVQETIKLADRIAKNSPIIVQTVKKSVNLAYETTLAQGLQSEQHLFQQTFATNDRKEGMKSFAEKRQPNWTSS
ncbi:unnamed protein product [Caenorhabditis angaria]|uniref:Probable enoyl-CoA hydratase, mitochondrial n=1 Tax=Caenorhabditis angaria TaxID=860376 RepID=A0A9P1IXU3_9PELO|nr:unnamed protein product [Caenorhabditis angaria]